LRQLAGARKLAALKNSTPVGTLGFLALLLFAGCDRAETSSTSAKPKGSVTFTKHIAPIVFQNCSSCHRPGESAPFPLLSYDDVRKRSRQIVEVTQSRYMPPWLPDSTRVKLVGERRLSDEQLRLIRQWVEDGAPEGDPKELPPVPQWSTRWALGEPDLVAKPNKPFVLPAEGREVYRNIVVPLPLSARRFVKGIEFRPNSRAVHHAFFRFDKTGGVAALDGKDGQPGFYGLHTPRTVESPATFASWQPGKTPRFFDADLAWPLEPGTLLVFQLHLQPTGKEEVIAPELAFYFADRPGTALTFKLPLSSYTIDIPAGETNYVARDAFVLPVDVEVRAVLPHAHYLARELSGIAELPDGSRRWLMAIPSWDFNWQGDYQFPQPLHLPRGTRLSMEYRFDNSTNNARNPNNPPQRVTYGMGSADEMAELWLQVVVKSPQEMAALNQAVQPRLLNDQILSNEALLRKNPQDAKAHAEIGTALIMLGRTSEGLARLDQALALDAAQDEAHYFKGIAYRSMKALDMARAAFVSALQVNPKHARARGNLGLVLAEQGRLAEAAREFELALKLNPQDEIAADMLRRIRGAQAQGR
jgi:Flp pilus assembly protein TadD/mono/diheme cytochrome c family protein